MKTIDIHSHFVFRSYLDGLKAQGIDPAEEDGFPTPSWSAEDHLEFMEKAEIERCILSLSSPHIHHGDDKAASELARRINEETAELCGKYPDRFSFAACIPLPAVKESVEEIVYAYDQLGAVGIKVPSNCHGVYLGDPVLDPVFEELDRRHAVITIHPARPQEVPGNVFTVQTAPLFEYLADTTRAVINMLTNSTLTRYPNIKVIVPHSGSFLPAVIHRLVGISEVLIPLGRMKQTDVMGDFQKLYFDIAGDTLPVVLESLMKVADPSHIMYGGDYPYTPAPIIIRKKQALEENEIIRPFLDDIMYENARKLYGIKD